MISENAKCLFTASLIFSSVFIYIYQDTYTIAIHRKSERRLANHDYFIDDVKHFDYDEFSGNGEDLDHSIDAPIEIFESKTEKPSFPETALKNKLPISPVYFKIKNSNKKKTPKRQVKRQKQKPTKKHHSKNRHSKNKSQNLPPTFKNLEALGYRPNTGLKFAV